MYIPRSYVYAFVGRWDGDLVGFGRARPPAPAAEVFGDLQDRLQFLFAPVPFSVRMEGHVPSPAGDLPPGLMLGGSQGSPPETLLVSAMTPLPGSNRASDSPSRRLTCPLSDPLVAV